MATDKPIPAIDHYDKRQSPLPWRERRRQDAGPWKFFRRDGSLMRSGSFESREADRCLANLRPSRQGPKGDGVLGAGASRRSQRAPINTIGPILSRDIVKRICG